MKIIVLLALCFFLNACLISEKELIKDENADNPFESDYFLVSGLATALDQFPKSSEGESLFIKIDSSKNVFTPYIPDNSIQLGFKLRKNASLKFLKLDNWKFWESRREYLLQYRIEPEFGDSDLSYRYVLIEIDSDEVTYYIATKNTGFAKDEHSETNLQAVIDHLRYQKESKLATRLGAKAFAIDSTRAAAHKQLLKEDAMQHANDALVLFNKSQQLMTVNKRESIKLLKSAADMGLNKALLKLYTLYVAGETDYIDKTSALASLSTAARGGSQRAINLLAFSYHYGSSIQKQDYTEAVKWYKKGGQLGNNVAQYHFGLALYKGIGITKDKVLAREWIRKAATNGNPFAQYNVGKTIVDKNPSDESAEAESWFVMASVGLQGLAKSGNKQARLTYAMMLEKGYGVTQNEKKAFNEVFQLAKSGYSDAFIKLAFMYIEGVGTSVNQVEGKRWLIKAKDNGSSLAKEILSR